MTNYKKVKPKRGSKPLNSAGETISATESTAEEIVASLSQSSSWQKQVRRALIKSTKHEANRRYGTRTPLFNYRLEHVIAVVSNAERLAELTGADKDVVVAAAWLHDIAKEKAGDLHPEVGAAVARTMLVRTDFPPEKIEKVAQAIAEHMGLWRDEPLTNLESMVLWDADKLAKIGLTAMFHWQGMAFAKGGPVTTKSAIKQGRGIDWHEKTVASMHTEPAKRAAVTRLAAYRAFWDGLDKELKGEDLV